MLNSHRLIQQTLYLYLVVISRINMLLSRGSKNKHFKVYVTDCSTCTCFIQRGAKIGLDREQSKQA